VDSNLKARIDSLVQGDPVFLFMKGTPTFPQCGFSNQVIQILKAYNVPFGSFDVLSDMDVRQGIKTYSEWPTIPQLYVKGEFIGGCDIVRESWESGELTELLQSAYPDHTLTPPKPPAKPRNISVAQAKAMMDQKGVRFLDVRTFEERDLAKIDGFEHLDQALAQTLLAEADKEIPMVFICHFGGRSGQAAEYFANQGFQNTYNIVGGIDSWSQEIDPSIPRY